jgi:aryl-alcohol dehydrogenase-like predicted oxidoreductase/serine/threonine protein phosphatase PrpC
MNSALDFRSKPLWIRITAFVLLLTFTGSSTVSAQSFARPVLSRDTQEPSARASGLTRVALEHLKLPAKLGRILEIHAPASSRGTVIYVQDAHANRQAQFSIRELVGFFQSEFGLNQVALEGGAGQLDPTLFRTCPEPEALKRLFENYAARGELAGASLAAALNREEAVYRGVENLSLYFQGLRAFHEALKEKAFLIADARARERRIALEKQKHYSPELLRFDRLVSRWEEKSADLAELVETLASWKKPEAYPSLGLILGALAKERAFRPREVASEIRGLAGALSRVELSREERAVLNGKLQAYLTERADPASLADFLLHLASAKGLGRQASRARHLARLARERSSLGKLGGPALFEELKAHISEVESFLLRNQKQRAIAREAKRLRRLRKLASLELTRDEWAEVKSAAPESAAAPAMRFYENAEKREEAMVENLLAILAEKQGPVLLVTGGFHAPAIQERLKERGISYALIQPEVGRSRPEENRYLRLMQGQASWREASGIHGGPFFPVYDAFAHAVMKELAHRHPAILKPWRDALIRHLAGRDGLSRARRYTRLLDQAAIRLASKDELARLRREWEEKIDRFFGGLNRLVAKKQVTEENLLRLVNTPPPVSAEHILPVLANYFALRVPSRLVAPVPQIAASLGTREIPATAAEETIPLSRFILFQITATEEERESLYEKLGQGQTLRAIFEEERWAAGNTADIDKQLRDFKDQFSGSHRPVVEPIVNAIDHSQHLQDPQVEIDITPHGVRIRDQGAGMNRQGVRNLLTPHLTGKGPWAKMMGRLADSSLEKASGRFGLGNLALLYYLDMPGGSLSWDTSDGEIRHQITVRHQDGVPHIAMRLASPAERETPQGRLARGTDLFISHPTGLDDLGHSIHLTGVYEAIFENLRYNRNAAIFVNGVKVNDFRGLIALDPQGQRVLVSDPNILNMEDLAPLPAGKKHEIAVTLNGVLLKALHFEKSSHLPRKIVFDLPPTADPALSRQELVLEKETVKILNAMTDALLSMGENQIPQLMSAWIQALKLIQSRPPRRRENNVILYALEKFREHAVANGKVYLPDVKELQGASQDFIYIDPALFAALEIVDLPLPRYEGFKRGRGKMTPKTYFVPFADSSQALLVYGNIVLLNEAVFPNHDLETPLQKALAAELLVLNGVAVDFAAARGRHYFLFLPRLFLTLFLLIFKRAKPRAIRAGREDQAAGGRSDTSPQGWTARWRSGGWVSTLLWLFFGWQLAGQLAPAPSLAGDERDQRADAGQMERGQIRERVLLDQEGRPVERQVIDERDQRVLQQIILDERERNERLRKLYTSITDRKLDDAARLEAFRRYVELRVDVVFFQDAGQEPLSGLRAIASMLEPGNSDSLRINAANLIASSDYHLEQMRGVERNYELLLGTALDPSTRPAVRQAFLQVLEGLLRYGVDPERGPELFGVVPLDSDQMEVVHVTRQRDFMYSTIAGSLIRNRAADLAALYLQTDDIRAEARLQNILHGLTITGHLPLKTYYSEILAPKARALAEKLVEEAGQGRGSNKAPRLSLLLANVLSDVQDVDSSYVVSPVLGRGGPDSRPLTEEERALVLRFEAGLQNFLQTQGALAAYLENAPEGKLADAIRDWHLAQPAAENFLNTIWLKALAFSLVAVVMTLFLRFATALIGFIRRTKPTASVAGKVPPSKVLPTLIAVNIMLIAAMVAFAPSMTPGWQVVSWTLLSLAGVITLLEILPPILFALLDKEPSRIPRQGARLVTALLLVPRTLFGMALYGVFISFTFLLAVYFQQALSGLWMLTVLQFPWAVTFGFLPHILLTPYVWYPLFFVLVWPAVAHALSFFGAPRIQWKWLGSLLAGRKSRDLGLSYFQGLRAGLLQIAGFMAITVLAVFVISAWAGGPNFLFLLPEWALPPWLFPAFVTRDLITSFLFDFALNSTLLLAGIWGSRSYRLIASFWPLLASRWELGWLYRKKVPAETQALIQQLNARPLIDRVMRHLAYELSRTGEGKKLLADHPDVLSDIAKSFMNLHASTGSLLSPLEVRKIIRFVRGDIARDAFLFFTEFDAETHAGSFLRSFAPFVWAPLGTYIADVPVVSPRFAGPKIVFHGYKRLWRRLLERDDQNIRDFVMTVLLLTRSGTRQAALKAQPRFEYYHDLIFGVTPLPAPSPLQTLEKPSYDTEHLSLARLVGYLYHRQSNVRSRFLLGPQNYAAAGTAPVPEDALEFGSRTVFNTVNSYTGARHVWLREWIQNILDEARRNRAAPTERIVRISIYRPAEGEVRVRFEDPYGMTARTALNELVIPVRTNKERGLGFIGDRGLGFIAGLRDADKVLVQSSAGEEMSPDTHATTYHRLVPVRTEDGKYVTDVDLSTTVTADQAPKGSFMEWVAETPEPEALIQDLLRDLQQYARFVDPRDLAIFVNGLPLNTGVQKMAESPSPRGDLEFSWVPMEGAVVQSGLYVEELDEKYLQAMFQPIREAIQKTGLVLNVPLAERLTLGRDGLHDPQGFLEEARPAIQRGSMEMLLALFLSGQINLPLLPYDIFDPDRFSRYDTPQARYDGQRLLRGEPVRDARYYDDPDHAAALLLALPAVEVGTTGERLSLLDALRRLHQGQLRFKDLDPVVARTLASGIFWWKFSKSTVALKNFLSEHLWRIALFGLVLALALAGYFLGPAIVSQLAAGTDFASRLAASSWFWAGLATPALIFMTWWIVRSVRRHGVLTQIGDYDVIPPSVRANPRFDTYWALADLSYRVGKALAPHHPLGETPPKVSMYRLKEASLAHAFAGERRWGWNLAQNFLLLFRLALYLSNQLSPRGVLKLLRQLVGVSTHELEHIAEKSAESTLTHHQSFFDGQKKLLQTALVHHRELEAGFAEAKGRYRGTLLFPKRFAHYLYATGPEPVTGVVIPRRREAEEAERAKEAAGRSRKRSRLDTRLDRILVRDRFYELRDDERTAEFPRRVPDPFAAEVERAQLEHLLSLFAPPAKQEEGASLGRVSIEAYSVRGGREEMEDAFRHVRITLPGVHGRGRLLMAGDGHLGRRKAGAQAALFAVNHFPTYFKQALREVQGEPHPAGAAMRLAIRRMGEDMRAFYVGTTFIAAYVPDDEDAAYVGVVGDSTAHVLDAQGEVAYASPEHAFAKLTDEAREEKIRDLSQRYGVSLTWDGARVRDSEGQDLMIYKALGDARIRWIEWEPDVDRVPLEKGGMLILASDGAAMNQVSQLNAVQIGESAKTLAEYGAGITRDNSTVVTAHFTGVSSALPTVPPSAADARQAGDIEALGTLVRGDMDLRALAETLEAFHRAGLPFPLAELSRVTGRNIDQLVFDLLAGEFRKDAASARAALLDVRRIYERLGTLPGLVTIPASGGKLQRFGPTLAQVSTAGWQAEQEVIQTLSSLRKEQIARGTGRVYRRFGNTEESFFVLGLGTIWMGRRWPPKNPDWRDPSPETIEAHLERALARMGNSEGVLMIDTAAAYGRGEERLGGFFRRQPHLRERAFIATKWGEDNWREDVAAGTETSTIDHSLRKLERSVRRSLKHLGKIDLLYIHMAKTSKPRTRVLRNLRVREAMLRMKREGYGGIRYLGASISDERVLEIAVRDNLLDWLDVIQLPVDIFFKRRDLVEAIHAKGLAIVINSPKRKGAASIQDTLRELLARKEVSVVLTGPSKIGHLNENIDAAVEAAAGGTAQSLGQSAAEAPLPDDAAIARSYRVWRGLETPGDPAKGTRSWKRLGMEKVRLEHVTPLLTHWVTEQAAALEKFFPAQDASGHPLWGRFVPRDLHSNPRLVYQRSRALDFVAVSDQRKRKKHEKSVTPFTFLFEIHRGAVHLRVLDAVTKHDLKKVDWEKVVDAAARTYERMTAPETLAGRPDQAADGRPDSPALPDGLGRPADAFQTELNALVDRLKSGTPLGDIMKAGSLGEPGPAPSQTELDPIPADLLFKNDPQKAHLFWFFEEFARSNLRFAQNSIAITVVLDRTTNRLYLRFENDGPGFNYAELAEVAQILDHMLDPNLSADDPLYEKAQTLTISFAASPRDRRRARYWLKQFYRNPNSQTLTKLLFHFAHAFGIAVTTRRDANGDYMIKQGIESTGGRGFLMAGHYLSEKEGGGRIFSRNGRTVIELWYPLTLTEDKQQGTPLRAYLEKWHGDIRAHAQEAEKTLGPKEITFTIGMKRAGPAVEQLEAHSLGESEAAVPAQTLDGRLAELVTDYLIPDKEPPLAKIVPVVEEIKRQRARDVLRVLARLAARLKRTLAGNPFALFAPSGAAHVAEPPGNAYSVLSKSLSAPDDFLARIAAGQKALSDSDGQAVRPAAVTIDLALLKSPEIAVELAKRHPRLGFIVNRLNPSDLAKWDEIERALRPYRREMRQILRFDRMGSQMLAPVAFEGVAPKDTFVFLAETSLKIPSRMKQARLLVLAPEAQVLLKELIVLVSAIAGLASPLVRFFEDELGLKPDGEGFIVLGQSFLDGLSAKAQRLLDAAA